MGFFSKKKEPKEGSLSKGSSNVSNRPISKSELPSKAKNPQQEPIQNDLLIPSKAAKTPSTKRVSTIIDDDEHHDFSEDDYDEDDNEFSEDYESEDDDYEEHTHAILPRPPVTVSQLSTLMGMCGLGLHTSKETLNKLANEELKRTFSLLSGGLKITRLPPTMSKSDPHIFDSVVGDPQVSLINELTSRLRSVLDLPQLDSQYLLMQNSKTLFERYGNVKDVIGRGAYGVIKIIDSSNNDSCLGKNKIYAVKELRRKSATDLKATETNDMFIERVVSEFIISSALNSKHIVRTLDFLLTLPSRNPSSLSHDTSEGGIKISQVMECTAGGDFFSYIKRCVAQRKYICIDEIDCMIKQIAKGLWYMHNHGVAHCDLKLENILITYENRGQQNARGKINLKISDFGKSSVVRTMWDTKEQLHPSSGGPIGSEPYLAPEEHLPSKSGISLIKKDCWALGIIILVLFNIRRSFFVGNYSDSCLLEYYDSEAHEENSKSYSSSYLWRSTDVKSTSLNKNRRYKDVVFDEYDKTAMLADYDKNTKEWTIQRHGTFLPIETLFNTPIRDLDDDALQRDADFEEDDFILRKYFIYKLLEVNPRYRATVDQLLKSDWLRPVECCCE